MRRVTPWVLCVAGLACATANRAPAPTKKPASPFPVEPLAGQKVAVFPVTVLKADSATGWDAFLTPRRAALDRADSALGAGLNNTMPRIVWVLAPAIRRAAQQAPQMLPNPDQLGFAPLATHALTTIPEPLHTQLRTLTGVAAGGRYALVPVSVSYIVAEGQNWADVTMTLCDTRLGAVSWSITARGRGRDPWDAIGGAVRAMIP